MSLEKFFDPKSVAIIGASRQPGKVGYEILKNIVDGGYKGKIFGVNPKAEEVEGIKCYKSLAEIGEAPELAIIVIPAKFAISALEECGKLGTKAVIVITAGFKEIGKAGAELEKDLANTKKTWKLIIFINKH